MFRRGTTTSSDFDATYDLPVHPKPLIFAMIIIYDVLTPMSSFYVITLHQRLQRLSPARDADAEGLEIILSSAEYITNIIEEMMLTWGAEHFPLIW